jgi:hypothetical protein
LAEHAELSRRLDVEQLHVLVAQALEQAIGFPLCRWPWTVKKLI